MSHHTTTDPACREHRTPRNALTRWWFNRRRGVTCRLCLRAVLDGEQR